MQRPVTLDLPTETSVSFHCISQFILSNPMGEQETELKRDRYEPGLSCVTWRQKSEWDHTFPCIPALCEKPTSDLHITWKLQSLDLDFMQDFIFSCKTFTETRKKCFFSYPRLLLSQTTEIIPLILKDSCCDLEERVNTGSYCLGWPKVIIICDGHPWWPAWRDMTYFLAWLLFQWICSWTCSFLHAAACHFL